MIACSGYDERRGEIVERAQHPQEKDCPAQLTSRPHPSTPRTIIESCESIGRGHRVNLLRMLRHTGTPMEAWESGRALTSGGLDYVTNRPVGRTTPLARPVTSPGLIGCSRLRRRWYPTRFL
jgi:hypothetical protein